MLKLLYILLVLAIHLVVQHLLRNITHRFGERNGMRPNRIAYVNKTIQITLGLISLGLISLILGVNYGELSIFVSSAFAILGVALFAQWSILSNITASVLIFFGFPYHLGDRVRVIEAGDERIEGEILDISLFCITIRDDDGNVATYPNNLLLQRPVVRMVSRTEDKAEDQAKETKETAE